MTSYASHTRQHAALGVSFALLCAANFGAWALSPLPPAQITDETAVDLLKTAYRDEAVGFGGEWSARHPSPDEENGAPVAASRKVCADSGRDGYGPRMIAVCTSFSDAGHVTPGLVDLWLLLDPRGERPARVGASKRDIATGSFGTPGEVGFFQIGPARTAFALDSGYANMGWGTSIRSLYFAESDRFDSLLTYGTQLDNSGACDPAEDKTCAKNAISVECTLRADTAKVEYGFYALQIEVSGERGGKPATARIPVPFANGAYAPPQQRLADEGCDQGF
ncbi:MAG: hypothetical protein IT473_10165 [Lysobacter sp.]|nr:hypothetical protein [Lysobacter sp.]